MYFFRQNRQMHVQTDGQDATRSHTMQACPDDLVPGASSIARVLETVLSVFGGNSSLFFIVITLYIDIRGWGPMTI